MITKFKKIDNGKEQKHLPIWEDVKPHIIEFGRLFLYNEEVRESKTLTPKIKELAQKDSDNSEQIVKLMLGY